MPPRPKRVKDYFSDQELNPEEHIIARLIEANVTLAGLPSNAPRLGYRTQGFGYHPEPGEVADTPIRNRPARPSPNEISRMDETLGWLSAIQDQKQREAVKARSLIDKETGQPPTWDALALKFGLDRKTVKARHDKGIRKILRHLRLGTTMH